MTSVPTKIWVGSHSAELLTQEGVDTYPYIRADIVDELRLVTNELLLHTRNGWDTTIDLEIRAAFLIKTLEDL